MVLTARISHLKHTQKSSEKQEKVSSSICGACVPHMKDACPAIERRASHNWRTRLFPAFLMTFTRAGGDASQRRDDTQSVGAYMPGRRTLRVRVYILTDWGRCFPASLMSPTVGAYMLGRRTLRVSVYILTDWRLRFPASLMSPTVGAYMPGRRTLRVRVYNLTDWRRRFPAS